MATPPSSGSSLAALNPERDTAEGAETQSGLSVPPHFTSKEGTEPRPLSRESQPTVSQQAYTPPADRDDSSHSMEQPATEDLQTTQDITNLPVSPSATSIPEPTRVEAHDPDVAPVEPFGDRGPSPTDLRSNTSHQGESAEGTILLETSSARPPDSYSESERTVRSRSVSPAVPTDLSGQLTTQPEYLQGASVSQPELYSATPDASDEEHSTDESLGSSPQPTGLPQPPLGNNSPYLRQRMGSFPSVEAQQGQVGVSGSTLRQSSEFQRAYESPGPADFQLPRWQPDAEVTYCPICNSQFNIFVRKHHCRSVPHRYAFEICPKKS
jgi:hypothetical protein